MGRDASALLLGSAKVVPRSTPKMFDYRYDNTKEGYCYHGAPRLAIRQGELKLLTNVDPAFPRTELYNLSASTFEADNLMTNIPPALAAQAAAMRKTLLEWADTLDPLSGDWGKPGKMPHLGCMEYMYPTGSAQAPSLSNRDLLV